MNRPFLLGGGAEDGSARLLVLAEELKRIASDLDGRRAASSEAERAVLAPPDADGLAGLARSLYAMRRRRGALFGSEALFGEPAWDMLLDLYIAERDGKRLPVTSTCIGAAVPTTTGLRWLAVLEAEGLARRESDPTDARRAYVRLTAKALSALDEYLCGLGEMLGARAPGAEVQPASRPKAASPA